MFLSFNPNLYRYSFKYILEEQLVLFHQITDLLCSGNYVLITFHQGLMEKRIPQNPKAWF